MTYLTTSKYKQIVKHKITTLAYQNLITKHNKMSKTKRLSYNQLTIQDYLKQKSPITNTQQKKLIFNTRTNMLKLRNNFKTQHKNQTNCRLNCNEKETNEHLTKCKAITIDCIYTNNTLTKNYRPIPTTSK